MTTPLRRQYLDIKRRYPHAILFFRMGDFYETFDDDAELVSRELEIVLTSRPISKGERVPLAGIPHHALDSYLAKLIAKGHKVAICEQVEEPQKGKKIVDRRVVRVVTPGTLIEDNLLASGRNNYLAAIYPVEGHCGLAYVDVSTGEFACAQLTLDALPAELERLKPSEVLAPPTGLSGPTGPSGHGTASPGGLVSALTPLSAQSFSERLATDALLQHFGASSLDGLGLSGYSLAAVAAGVIVGYLADTQAAALKHVTRISMSRADFMQVDANTVRNLEVFESPGGGMSLLSVLDRTRTPMGARLLRRWLARPLLDVAAINARLDAVEFFFASGVRRSRIAQTLSQVPDLERCLARVSTAAAGTPGPATPRDLLAIRRGLDAVPALRHALVEEGQPQLAAGLHDCADSAGLIAAAISDDPGPGRIIAPGFSSEMDALKSLAGDARQLLAQLEARERERTGIKTLKVGYNRVFGYYIEISNANAGRVPEDYQRRQTLVGGERYTTPELRELEDRILHAQERHDELEGTLLRQVCAQVAADVAAILETAAAVAHLDCYCALAEAAALGAYVRPEIADEPVLDLRDARHPVVERMLPEGEFVANDALLSSTGSQVILLTGPNMAGKSTYMRGVALIALMAQAGSFVPAASANVGVVDRIFTRIGAADDIGSGRSTFMVEMVETAEILHHATPLSLLVFDEIGRGTSTYDGMAIARAVVEFIHNRADAQARTLFATHYHELTDLASSLPRVKNFNVAVAEENGEVVFLHRILPGSADRSYGVHVAQLAGLPKPVVQRAAEILADLESKGRQEANALSAGGSTTPGGSGFNPASPQGTQLTFFGAEDPFRREVAEMDVDGLTPLQALNTLFELVEKARSDR